MPLFFRDTYKKDKWGFFKGMTSEIKMWSDEISYKGFFYFVKMLFQFCRTEYRG